MLNNNELNQFPVRRNPRLKRFDYSSPNYYFVTICTRDKACLFGSPLKLSQKGVIANTCLQEITQHFRSVVLDKWVIMPNHVHAILVLNEGAVSLSTIIGQYKSAVSKQIHELEPQINVWQSSFHDHVIRNQADYEKIWTYIEANPARWMDDCFYTPQPDL